MLGAKVQMENILEMSVHNNMSTDRGILGKNVILFRTREIVGAIDVQPFWIPYFNFIFFFTHLAHTPTYHTRCFGRNKFVIRYKHISLIYSRIAKRMLLLFVVSIIICVYGETEKIIILYYIRRMVIVGNIIG